MKSSLKPGKLQWPQSLCNSPVIKGTPISVKLKEPATIQRQIVLKNVDRELSKRNNKVALSLIKHMQGKPGGLRGFGAAKQAPRTIASLNDLELSGIDTSSLESLLDQILLSINSSAEFRLSDEVTLAELESRMHGRIPYGNPRIYQNNVSVGSAGGLMYEGTYESLCEDHLKCMQHEAGHFLISYLLGILPTRYTVSNMEALRNNKIGVAGGSVKHLGFEFLREIHTEKKSLSRGQLNIDVLFDKFLCVILAGLVAEYLVFGHSQGLHSDVDKLYKVVKKMDLTDIETDNRVRWAIINTITILNRHQEARSRLAEAMGLGKSIGWCIDVIENSLNDQDI